MRPIMINAHSIFRRFALIAGILLAFLPAMLSAQAPRVTTRFANPAYDPAKGQYALDIQVAALGERQAFFGMNLRFYYDASYLKFSGLDKFAEGHAILRDVLRDYVGSDVSGVQMLGFGRAAGYVNGAVQRVDERYILDLQPGVWRTLCRATFIVPEHLRDETQFCPSLIWDLKPFTGEGGLTKGSDGLCVSVDEGNRSTRAESLVATVTGEPYNWQYNRLDGMPFGRPREDECISLAQTTSVSDPDLTAEGDYVLFQNKPNPFDEQTTIDFVLPYAQRARINLYTVQGELLEVIDGQYPAGRSSIRLERKPWMDRVALVYYQLAAEDNVSLVRKMNMVTR